jgi:hypothetical protein
MIQLKIDTSKMEAALADFAKEARKDLGAMMKSQAGILVGHMIALTPPASGKGHQMSETNGGEDHSAKRRGEDSVEADIRKIFIPTKLSEKRAAGAAAAGFSVRPAGSQRAMIVRDTAFDLAKMKKVHGYARNPLSGRTRSLNGLSLALTKAGLLNKYIRQEQRKVGLLSAGWLTAARAMNTTKRSTPAWISRHGQQPGGATMQVGGSVVSIRVFNNQRWFPGDMGQRVQLAIDRRERGMRKATEAIIARRARTAQRKQG